MIRVIGVRFRPAGKLYYFDPNGYDIRLHDNVIVETVRGVEYGRVILAPTDVDDSKVVQPLKSVIRVATKEDDKRQADNHEKEKQAYQICLEKIRKHGLPMKLISAEYTFDNNKVLYYFTADGRIDFRELVRDLASVFKTRIELRQIGVRDETKILGGIGICGRPLCCQTFLTDFAPVSIKMAKEQNFSLNPMKISGVCGRLMCCLKNEESTYEWLNKKLPNVGEKVTLENGERGEVQSVNVLRQTVKVLITQEDGDTDIREYKASELKFRPKGRRGGKGGRSEDKAAEPEGESSAETMTERGDSSPEADGGAGRDGADRDSADRDGAGHRDGADRDGAGHRDGAADGAGHRDQVPAGTMRPMVPAEAIHRRAPGRQAPAGIMVPAEAPVPAGTATAISAATAAMAAVLVSAETAVRAEVPDRAGAEILPEEMAPAAARAPAGTVFPRAAAGRRITIREIRINDDT